MKEIEQFKKYLEVEKNYSLYTIRNYEIDIIQYLEYCDLEKINYKDITYLEARNYLNYLYSSKKEKAASASRKISSIRSFYRYLENFNIDNQSFNLLKLPKKGKRLPKFFEYNELEQLFEIPDLNTPLGERNALILEMLYATGMRVGELISIKVNDINHFDKTIKILGKGNKERIVYYNKVTENRLNLYLKNGRNKLNKNNDDYLFLNHLGGQLTTRGVELVLNKIIEQTALTKKINDLHKKGGRKPELCVEDLLLMTLKYYRDYPTFFSLGLSFGINKSNAFRIGGVLKSYVKKCDILYV